MANLNWQRNKHLGRGREPAAATPPGKKGGWTHIKREPVRTFTPAEIAAWEQDRNGGQR